MGTPAAAGVTEELEPGPLDGDGTEQALRNLLGAEVDQKLVDFAAGAGGNPRLLAELALGLVAEGLVRENGGVVQLVEPRVPRRLLEFVVSRLGELSANCQQFLKVAAALGRSFMLADVSSLLGRSSATLLTVLDEAMAAGFVVAVERQLAFQSEFVLLGIIESIPVPARDALRSEAMTLSGRGAQSYESLWMTERPTDGVDREGVGGACSRAHRLIMNGDAAAGVRVAERMLATPGMSPADRLDAEASVILGYFLLGRKEAEKVAQKVLWERGAAPGDVAALMALAVRSNLLWRAGKLAESLSLGRAAVHNSENVDPVWRFHFQLALAGKLANLRDFDKAESLIADAEAGLRGLPTPVWTAAPAVMRSRLSLQAGRIGEARREAELATSAAGQDAVPMLRPLAYSVLSTASFYLGDLPAAVDYLRRAHSAVASQVVLDSVQYAWADMLITVKREGPRAAAQLLSGRYGHLPTQRSLYIEDPSAAAFLVRLARDVGDSDLERSVLETVDGLAGDNPGISVIGLTAMHAKALANSASAALALIIVQSPDPISVALATEELAKLYAARTPLAARRTDPAYSEEVGPDTAACWSVLSDMERRIAYLVSVGLTNRQIAKQVHLSAHTVNYHLRKIYRKLGINTRVELAHGAASYSSKVAIYSMGDDENSGHIAGEAV
ncbi:LuxR family transcriptional regulator [Micromonospora pallida]|uniref:LuxR family transcriptional regulator n=1 Tax=Micromonospora pallida TaxID=145854 RepID=UPI001C4045C4|nr:LuxR family transcriptional regulator [Micromonospora pallida]